MAFTEKVMHVGKTGHDITAVSGTPLCQFRVVVSLNYISLEPLLQCLPFQWCWHVIDM